LYRDPENRVKEAAMLKISEAAVLVLLHKHAGEYSVAVVKTTEPNLNADGIGMGQVQIPVTQLNDITGMKPALEYALRSLQTLAKAEEARFSR
jgi:hypothetical protein